MTVQIEPGDVLRRVWGDGFMVTEMRVSKVDEAFVYCDAMRKDESEAWTVLPTGSDPWKFDLTYGVETDEEQGWGVIEGARKIVLSRVEKIL